MEESKYLILTLLAGITDKAFDSTRVQLLFHNNIEKGLFVFESLLAGKNIETAVDCARKMPQQYKNDYYQSMLTLLYGKNNTDEQNTEDLQRVAVYVMGKCDDALDFIDQFILWMKGSSCWIAHTALQAMLNTGSASDKLLEAYQWMWDRYENNSAIRANLLRFTPFQ